MGGNARGQLADESSNSRDRSTQTLEERAAALHRTPEEDRKVRHCLGDEMQRKQNRKAVSSEVEGGGSRTERQCPEGLQCFIPQVPPRTAPPCPPSAPRPSFPAPQQEDQGQEEQPQQQEQDQDPVGSGA